MSKKATKQANWVTIKVSERVDSFNQLQVMDDIQKLVDQGEIHIALNLEITEFISFTAIKFISEIAKDLKRQKGVLALYGTSEKLKRQISIYASLDDLEFFRSKSEIGQDFSVSKISKSSSATQISSDKHPN